jgi:hypothetical protein
MRVNIYSQELTAEAHLIMLRSAAMELLNIRAAD